MLSLILALAISTGSQPPATGPAATPVLEVPYLAQTEALCGGAAVAMLFRYWGERHASVQQFAPLVDARAGGISTSALVAAVRERGWTTNSGASTMERLHDAVRAGLPVILLLEDRPNRYHFVVAVAVNETTVTVHDPTWGPSRAYSVAELRRRWMAADFWALTITPGPGVPAPRAPDVAAASLETTPAPADACAPLVGRALDEAAANRLDAAATTLVSARHQCPASAAAARELAGVRFAQQRWGDAASLAAAASRLEPADAYTWDLLASSRFMLNDQAGALEAWNQLDRPRLDRVQIGGVRRTRYSLVDQYLGLTPDRTLTARDFRLAERRLDSLPDRLDARVDLRPDADGYAVVAASVAERPRLPRTATSWMALAVRSAIDRELAVTLPGFSGQGEIWRGSWRWWENRPRVAFGFAAPRAGWLNGVWGVDVSWEAETYAPGGSETPRRQERTRGAITMSRWLTPQLRLDAAAGVDAWDDNRKAAFASGALEHRWFGDRMAVQAGGGAWAGFAATPAFQTARLRGWARSSAAPRGLVATVDGTLDWASTDAPLALWSAAGEGRARPGLLRGHRLLRDGIITGDLFGRQVATLNVEAQRWIASAPLIPLGIAVFADTAAAGRGFTAASTGARFDVGLGLRLQLPGTDGTLRVDYGVGVRDGDHALTVGWIVR